MPSIVVTGLGCGMLSGSGTDTCRGAGGSTHFMSMPVSSFTSRVAATERDSPSSTRPPGKHKPPTAGGLPRCMSSTCGTSLLGHRRSTTTPTAALQASNWVCVNHCWGVDWSEAECLPGKSKICCMAELVTGSESVGIRRMHKCCVMPQRHWVVYLAPAKSKCHPYDIKAKMSYNRSQWRVLVVAEVNFAEQGMCVGVQGPTRLRTSRLPARSTFNLSRVAVGKSPRWRSTEPAVCLAERERADL